MYEVTVSDSDGCSVDTVVVVPVFNPMALATAVNQDTCGAGLGTAEVIVLNPGELTPPFTFEWDSLAGSQNTPIATGLSEGNYNVIVTDNAGCSSEISANVGSTDNNFDLQAVAYDAVCFGDSSGALRVTGLGGNGNYRFEWW